MKRISLIIIMMITVICMIPAGCGTAAEDESDPQDGIILSGFSLGMSPEQMFEQLDRMGMKIAAPSDYLYEDSLWYPDEINPADVDDGRVYHAANCDFSYKTEDYNLTFTFTFEGELNEINSKDSAIRTGEGLAVGDAFSRVVRIYGKDGEKIEGVGVSVVRYNTEDGYLFIYYKNDIVIGWTLRSYSYLYND